MSAVRAALLPSLSHGLLRWLRSVMVLCFTLLLASPSFALDVPPLRGHVNDQAHLLSSSEASQLEQRLSAYEQRTGQQFALLTIDTLGGDAIESYSNPSARAVEAR
ncbi:MAG: TPM domain-containing protein [Polyangiaceae bacterium]